MNEKHSDSVRARVLKNYGEIADKGFMGCGGTHAECCGGDVTLPLAQHSTRLGYSEDELRGVPHGANLGLGCGNPQSIAALKRGETVVDLGSGGGFDCFLAAKQVGEAGRVIGVDMTPQMLDKARENAREDGYTNVEFRLGEIEHLPIADNSADAIISNCVINLSPEKWAVFRESFRVLKPGGRLAITDIVATTPLPPEWKSNADFVSACVAGAATVDDMERMLAEAGFQKIRIRPREESRSVIRQLLPGLGVEDYVASATIEAVKPVAHGRDS
jgi:SAM-dependent methyltransferase